MPISIAATPKRVDWDDPEAHRRADAELERRIVDALQRARPYVDVALPPAPPAEQTAEDGAAQLEQAVALIKQRLEAPHGLERAQLIELCQLAVELQGLHSEHNERRLSRRLRALNGFQGALARPHGDASIDRLLERATIEACRSCGFDRAILFRVDGSLMRVKASYFRGDDAWAAEAYRVADQAPPDLSNQLLETEMIRRRAPALISDPMDDPRAYRPIIDTIRSSGYVVVPIMPEGRIIATLHADTHFSGRRVDAIDRDALAAFAAGLGSMIERQVLAERLVAQREHVRSMLQATDAFVAGFSASEIALDVPAPTPQAPASAVPPVTSTSQVASLLSPRELEVLRMMAAGATNAVIAEQLVLAEGTVKSHVKRILRKLHAANRAEAVSRFLRLEGGLSAVEEFID